MTNIAAKASAPRRFGLVVIICSSYVAERHGRTVVGLHAGAAGHPPSLSDHPHTSGGAVNGRFAVR